MICTLHVYQQHRRKCVLYIQCNQQRVREKHEAGNAVVAVVVVIVVQCIVYSMMSRGSEE